jgi:hypothetical protein
MSTKKQKESVKADVSRQEFAAKKLVGDLVNSSANAITNLYANTVVGDGISGLDVVEIRNQLIEHSEAMKSGDLQGIEDMLIYQAHVLSHIFNMQVGLAARTEYIENQEIHLRNAFKAQNQTRQTVSTIAELKGVKSTTFIKQQNQAVNQQIINSDSGTEISSKKTEAKSNKLLEGIPHERLDTRTKSSAVKSNKEMATLGK